MSKIDEIEKRINADEDFTIQPDGTVRDMTPEEIASREATEKAAREKVESRSRKPILCLDFDGVIHSYSSGWQGADTVIDPPVDGALEFIENALPHFRVAIFSSRTNQRGGLKAMQTWLMGHFGLMIADRDGQAEAVRAVTIVHSFIEWPTDKPSAFVTLDDRAITFDGTWPSIETLREFKPWNKR